MAQMDTSPVEDPRIIKPVLPIASGAPAAPETQPAMPRVPSVPPVQGHSQALPFPYAGVPGQSQAQQNQANLVAQGSRISRIHNPVLKGLAGVGDAILGTFAPRAEQLIPGTEGHYGLELRRASNAVKSEQETSTAQSENALRSAQALHAEAQAAAAPHETASRTITTDKGIMQWDPDTKRYDISAGASPEKPESSGKTITTDQGIMQWNPETSRYDIKAGNSPQAKEGGTVHQLEDGTLIIAHPDGTAVPVTVNGQPAKGKVTAPAGDDFSQFYQKWLKEKGQQDSASNEKKARAEWSASGQAPERPPQAMMLGAPDEQGNRTAQLVRPGQRVAAGSVSTGGASSEAVNADKAAQGEKKAREDAQKEYQIAQQLVANPSPTNDVALVMRYIGATKPDSLGKLRLNNNEMNLVLGTRSTLGDLEALVQRVQNGQKLTPQQRQDMLATMKLLTGQGTSSGPTAGTVENGYRFKGGDPANQSNWEKVK